jgi:hypothetical protein
MAVWRSRRPVLISVVTLVVTAIVAGSATWLVLRDDAPGRSAGVVPSVPSPVIPPPAPADDPDLQAGFDAILRDRARGILTGRRDLFLARVDPRDAAFRAEQVRFYENLRALRPSELSFLRHTYWPEPKVQQRHGPEAHAFLVVMRIRIGGIDPAPRVTEVGYSVARRGGRYLLVDDDDIDADLGTGRHREPWDFGPIEVVRSRTVVVVVSRGEGRLGRRLARDAAAVLPTVRRLTGRPLPGVLVAAVNDPRVLGGDLQTGGDSVAAVAVPNLLPVTPRSRSRYRVVGSRIMIQPAFRNKAGRRLLAHEFTHAAWSTSTTRPPTWLVEGFAEYVEMAVARQAGYGARVERRRQKVLAESFPKLRSLPIDGLFHGEYGEDSYGISWVLVQYLADEYGLDRVRAYYADHPYGQDAALPLRRHFRLAPAGLIAAARRG